LTTVHGILNREVCKYLKCRDEMTIQLIRWNL